jgi:hypothetical protein
MMHSVATTWRKVPGKKILLLVVMAPVLGQQMMTAPKGQTTTTIKMSPGSSGFGGLIKMATILSPLVQMHKMYVVISFVYAQRTSKLTTIP